MEIGQPRGVLSEKEISEAGQKLYATIFGVLEGNLDRSEIDRNAIRDFIRVQLDNPLRKRLACQNKIQNLQGKVNDFLLQRITNYIPVNYKSVNNYPASWRGFVCKKKKPVPRNCVLWALL